MGSVATQVLLDWHFVHEQAGALRIHIDRHGSHEFIVVRQVKALDLLALVQVDHGHAFGQIVHHIGKLWLSRIGRNIQGRPSTIEGNIFDDRIRFRIDNNQIIRMSAGQEIPLCPGRLRNDPKQEENTPHKLPVFCVHHPLLQHDTLRYFF